MATRLFYYPGADAALYAIFRNSVTGTVWNGTAMAAWSDAAIATYDVLLTFVGGDGYTLEVPDDLPTGQNYTAAVFVPDTPGTPATTDTKLPDEWEFKWNGSTAEDAAPAEANWHYAQQSDVESLLGEANLRIISNIGDDDSTTNTARLQSVGEWADAYFNARFASMGYTTPLAGTTAGTDLLVTEANARLTAWKLNQARVIASVAGKTPAEVAAVMEEHKKLADQFFRDLSMRRISITATKLYTRASKIEAYIPDTVTVCRGFWGCQL